MRLGSFLACVLLAGFAAHAEVPLAVIADPPRDKDHPAALADVHIPSHGVTMNGVTFVASGAGPHAVEFLLHGFPGNEQNLDLAQAIRRAGFDVLTLHYRGAWGSPGAFSFGHAIEDSDAAVKFLRDPANAAKFRYDPKRIFLAGHSMGGFMSLRTAVAEPGILGVVMISAWDIAFDARTEYSNPKGRKYEMADIQDRVIPLAGANLTD